MRIRYTNRVSHKIRAKMLHFYCIAIKFEVSMTKIGIVGYGNLGKAVEQIAVGKEGVEVVGIFTRRNPDEMKSPFGTRFFSQKNIFDFQGQIDVLALTVGSADDLVPLALDVASKFNTVDSYDNHGNMREYVSAIHKVATGHNHLSVVGVGWDPGLFSLMRGLFEGIMCTNSHTFWGKGVSQGHSEAIRKINGVKMAVQYTVPNTSAIEKAKMGQCNELKSTDKHKRECYVVAEEGADRECIENQIKNIKGYFVGYDTTVHFVDETEFCQNHNNLYHGGRVLCSKSIDGKNFYADFTVQMQSNPHFTASILLAYACAVDRMYKNGDRGAKTILDLPIGCLFDCNRLDIIEKYL